MRATIMKLPAILMLAASIPAHAGVLRLGKVQLMCHRTANRDAPENTLESLVLAAHMGCNIVEVDVRMTLDGVLVLNHDGMLERLSEGMGDVETTSFDELQMYDFGGWMSQRFASMHIPRFTDALRVAREQGIALHLDIKEKGEGPAIFGALRSEQMLERVIFGGDEGNANDLKRLYPAADADLTAWFEPGCSPSQVAAAHAQGKFVVANFSSNAHEMDLPAMRAAVAAGVDAINVDYPRFGADAVGRPVEAKLAALAAAGSTGNAAERTAAIRELSLYSGFPTQQLFLRWLHDPEDRISRAAAVALVAARPATPADAFIDTLASEQSSARRNAAWALGITHAPATAALLPLLIGDNPAELKEVLLALSRCPGDVPAVAITPFLHHSVPIVRAAAALALARHQPHAASRAVPQLLLEEEQESAAAYARYVQGGRHKLTQAEIDPLIELYREHMKLIHALAMLSPNDALPLLLKESLRSADDSSHVTSVLAGYELWDRIAADPSAAIAALDSPVPEVADRAEWMLVKAGPAVLPAVRASIGDATPAARARLIHVLAWQGDAVSLTLLRQLKQVRPEDAALIDWATQKIEVLEFIDERQER